MGQDAGGRLTGNNFFDSDILETFYTRKSFNAGSVARK